MSTPALDVRMIDLDACGGARTDCAEDSATRGSGHNGEGCLRVWTFDDSFEGQLEGRSFHCSALSVSGSESRRVELKDVELSSTNLTLKSTEPVTFRLKTSHLSKVWVSLDGPVTLSFVDGWLDDVHFELGQQARIELERTGSERLMASGMRGARAGSVTLRRMRVVESHLKARELRVESVRLDHTLLDADSFTGADVQWEEGVLKADEATLSAAALGFVDVKECRVLNILESYLNQVRAVACDELTRIYTSTVEKSVFDGPIQSDLSGFHLVRFGARAATEVSAWDSAFAQVAFCEEQKGLWLGGESEFLCVQCADAEATLDACLLPDATAVGDAGACEALAAPSACEAPFPERERP